jgi:hypothetical protein
LIIRIDGGRVVDREWKSEVCLCVGLEHDIFGGAAPDGGIIDGVKNLKTKETLWRKRLGNPPQQ